MKNRKIFSKIVAVVLALSLMLAALPNSAAFAQGTIDDLQLTEKGELWKPEEDTAPTEPNTEGDLPYFQLQNRILPSDDKPEVVSQEFVDSNKHVNRLRAQEEDLNTIVFQNRDNTKTMYYYFNAVKYVDANGVIRDKRNVLTDQIDDVRFKNDYAYVNADNDIRTYFPKTLDEKSGIVLEGQGVRIDSAPVFYGTEDSKGFLNTNSTTARKSSIQTESKAEQDVVLYPDAFGENTALRFTPTFEGFKEDILLERYTGTHEFTYQVQTNGLSLIAESGLCFFVDPLTGEKKAVIDKIVVSDSRNNRPATLDTMKGIQASKAAERTAALSEKESTQTQVSTTDYNHHYRVETVKPDEEYRITLVIDEAYLKAEDTVYPVTIDPSTTIVAAGSGTSKTIMDAPIYSGRPATAHGRNGYSVLGYVPSYGGAYFGVGRELMKFPGLVSNPTFQSLSAANINNVNVYMRATGGGPSPSCIDAYIFYGSNWTENTVTCQSSSWNSYTSLLDSSYISGATWTYFNITTAAKAWKSGTYSANTGIILKNENESNANYQWNFATTEYNGVTSLKPFVTVNYYHDAGASTGITNGGTYYIKNYSTGKYMEDNKAGGVRQNPKSTVFDDIPHQRWRVTHWGHGMYWLQPMNGYDIPHNTYPYALTANASGGLSVTGKSSNVNVNQLFILTRNGDGTYYIRPAITGYDRSLTVASIASGTSVTTAVHNSYVPCMKWRFEAVNSFNVSIYNYYDYGFQARFGSSTNSIINNRQTRINNFLLSVFNITVENNFPVRRESYADKCRGVGSIDETVVEVGCNHDSPACDKLGLCSHVLTGMSSCNLSCPSPYHHNNSLKIHSWFTYEYNNPTADVSLLWIGHKTCDNQYVPWSSGTHITATLYDPTNPKYANYTAFHEIGHSLGARGDENCLSTSCVMAYSTSWETYFSLLESPDKNTFCAQCKNEIRENLLQHY